jgi:predicted O-methyltransferase YrrM
MSQPITTHLPAPIQTLLQDQPKFHAVYNDVTLVEEDCCNWSIDPTILEWIAQNVQPGFATLETGCGYSSVAFAVAGARHTVLSPIAAEHAAIQRWCAAQSIDLSQVEFLAQASQDVIHSLPQTPLDVVLIDGDHAFPMPLIDWYYTAERVKEGGMMLVDDTQIITGKILKDFLAMETDRWKLVGDFDKTSVFQRITSNPVTRGVWFGMQPYCCQE